MHSLSIWWAVGLSCVTWKMPQLILINAEQVLSREWKTNTQKQVYCSAKLYVEAVKTTEVRKCLDLLEFLEWYSQALTPRVQPRLPEHRLSSIRSGWIWQKKVWPTNHRMLADYIECVQCLISPSLGLCCCREFLKKSSIQLQDCGKVCFLRKHQRWGGTRLLPRIMCFHWSMRVEATANLVRLTRNGDDY